MGDYIFYSVAGLAIAFTLNFLFLKNEKNFYFNRFYLLGTLALCLLAPTLEMDYGTTYLPEEKFQLEPSFTTTEKVEFPKGNVVEIIRKENFPIEQLLFYAYLVVSAFFLIRFFRNLYKIIYQIKFRSKKHFLNFKIIETEEKGNPSSFFNYLFVHKNDLENSNFAESVIAHELAHSKQFHSADIIFIELISCFFWFNPFVWLYRKEIIQNHEYLADAAVLNAGIDMETYATQLINCGDFLKQPLISGFSFIKTKNRLNMLHKKSSSKVVIGLKAAVVLVLFAGVFAFSSYTPTNKTKPFVVLVDAGHGGHDPGHLNEKEVNLAVARELQKLEDENIKILLTRDDDYFLTLDERVEVANETRPDLFISLHCNNALSNTIRTGVEAFYSEKGKQPEKSKTYSKILVSELLNGTAEKGEIKTANFLVLRDSEVPGILLELGFLSNPTEAEKLNNPAHQKLIAENIFSGLKKIKASAE